MIVILMGVTGTGKTTVGHGLAQTTGWLFADADNFHSPANRAKMHAGIPLTDEDREPWLRSIHKQIAEWVRDSIDGILACSALKESYRAALTEGLQKNSVLFIYLTGPAKVIRQRLEARHGHYMPASLLSSQLETLEPPRNAIEISITQSVPDIVQKIRQILGGVAREAYAGDGGTKLN